MKSKAVQKKPVKKKISVKKAAPAKAALTRKRPIHKRVLLHPITVFFLLCVGVFIVGSTFRARADEVVVTAKVAAPALSDGAFIVSPSDGATFSNGTVSVVGTCPSDSYVEVTRNAALAGVSTCDSGGAFEVVISLLPGTNILQAQAYNMTNDPGPVTPSISVIYNAPVVISPGPISLPEVPAQGAGTETIDVSSVETPGDLPVILTSFEYKPVSLGSAFSWDGLS